MPHAFSEVVVVRQGDANGNRMVLRLTTQRGVVIYAMAVPQDWPARTGPTWTYLFQNDGITLIDAGASGSYGELQSGIEQTGFRPADIDRVIITHGHSDHDGAAAQLVNETGAELWAHDIYAHLIPYHPWQIQRRAGSAIHQEMRRVAQARTDTTGFERHHKRNEDYIERRQGLEVKHGIKANERFGDLTFMHAPGHSPDEICATLDGVVFTGDHVLPEITPHPTTKVRYESAVKQRLPAEYLAEDDFYGLATYLRSLQAVVDLGTHITVLPAHRLFNKNKFNFQSVDRAGEVVRHHGSRLGRILRKIGSDPTGLEQITRAIFDHRTLIGGNLYMALSEVVAHIELLEDMGDVELTSDQKLRRTGSENYRQFIQELGSH